MAKWIKKIISLLLAALFARLLGTDTWNKDSIGRLGTLYQVKINFNSWDNLIIFALKLLRGYFLLILKAEFFTFRKLCLNRLLILCIKPINKISLTILVWNTYTCHLRACTLVSAATSCAALPTATARTSLRAASSASTMSSKSFLSPDSRWRRTRSKPYMRRSRKARLRPLRRSLASLLPPSDRRFVFLKLLTYFSYLSHIS